MKQRCEYNNQCQEELKNGKVRSYAWNVPNPPSAKFKVTFYDKEQESVFEYNVCSGCKGDLEFTCEYNKNYELLEVIKL